MGAPKMRMELERNEDVVFSRQHQRVEETARGGIGNQSRMHVGTGFVYFWLSAALLSMFAWVLHLFGVFDLGV